MELKTFINVIVKKVWIIVIVSVLAGAVSAYTCFYILDPVYESSTTLYVSNINSNSSPVMAYEQILVGQQLTKDYTELIKSRFVLEIVMQELGLTNMLPEQLAKNVSVVALNETRILKITVKAKDKELAKDIANSIAATFSDKAVELMKVSTVSIIDRAVEASKPSEPKRLQIICFSVLAAIALTCSIIFLIEYLDNTIKSSDDVEKYLELNVIGIIPKFAFKGK
ncbi:MAG: YveK family protein [Acetivibrionales bacterium]|jgi:capsular polysaccharide biosynthesis protein